VEGHVHFPKCIEKVNASLFKSDSAHVEFEYVPGVHGIAFPIISENEYHGCVIGVAYRKEDASKIDAGFVKAVVHKG
jgi:hypothetical protein